MKETLNINQKHIESIIYEILGKQVMLDSDLAKLYGTETKRINEAVRNNPEKFPERFSWKISKEESQSFLVEIFDQKKKIETRGGKYSNPRVFTEQGVAMLATILHTKVATQVSIAIMDAFVSMKKYISSNLLEQKYINNQVLKNTEDIKLLQESFQKFEEKKLSNEIFYDGQIYDAYSKIIDIMNSAKESLAIIDSYADKSTLDMISKIKIPTTLIVKKNSLLKEIDIQKYQSQYHNLRVIYDSSFHDRFFLIDNSILYHCGTSLNHAGSKTFAINKINDNDILYSFLIKISKIKI